MNNPSATKIQLIDCNEAAHADAILAIFNDAIVHSTALYDYEPRQPQFMAGWFASKRAKSCPVLGAVDEQGTLLAFASWGAFRDYPANKYTIEHSIYVHRDHRRRGLARYLMQALIERAIKSEKHVMMGVIDAANTGSIALHEQLGFRQVGTLPQIGFKFGRWLDVVLYQLILDTPHNPQDD
ncbi:GNAT family N-acetyltransferase [Neisseriaceae bacterium ESL0693]|nr:GNAT family N-acetyltransferase [Neisseriaceae bacterium ESL0693]